MFQAPEVLSKERGADGRPICFPEYVKCEISYQSDVYSLGAVMWSLIMRRNPDRPGGAFPLTPALVADSRLRELVNDMLQPDPAKRHRASHLILRFPPAPAPAPAPPKVIAQPLPPGWAQHTDPASGKPFYAHAATGQSQWERPAAAAAAPDMEAVPGCKTTKQTVQAGAGAEVAKGKTVTVRPLLPPPHRLHESEVPRRFTPLELFKRLARRRHSRHQRPQ